MSGSVLNYWAFLSRTKAVLRAFELGAKLGVLTIRKKKLLQKLYAVSPEELVRAAASMMIVSIYSFILFTFCLILCLLKYTWKN